MSFLGARLAGKEGAYFFEASKSAVTRLAEKNPPINNPKSLITNPSSAAPDSSDVLPEILRHSLPAKVFQRESLSESSSNSGSPKWSLGISNSQFSGVSPDVLNPLRGYLSLPQVTLGPKRWQLPTAESSVVASTANELHREHYTQVSSEKVRAAAEGLAQVGKSFAVATAIIFSTAALTVGLAASRLDVHNSDDIRARGKELVQPKFKIIGERLSPWREWAETATKKWHHENEIENKERPMIKELSKILGAKSSS